MRILLLSTADTDLLAARASGADYRLANPARLAADEVPALLDGVDVVVVRLLGGRRAWPDGLDAVLATGVPAVVLGGEAMPDAELMALSTVPAGVVAEALALPASRAGRTTCASWHRFLSDTVLLTGEGFAPPARDPGVRRARRARRRRRTGPPSASSSTGRTSWPATPRSSTRCATRSHGAGGNAAAGVLRLAARADRRRGPAASCSTAATRWSSPCSPPAAPSPPTRPPAATRTPGTSGALAALDVPVLQGAVPDQRPRAAGPARDAALTPMDAAMQVAIPEFDGRLITVPFSFKETGADGIPVYVADPERAARVAGIAVRARPAAARAATPTSGSRSCCRRTRPSTPGSATPSAWTPRPRRSRCSPRCARPATTSATASPERRRRADPRADRGRRARRGVAHRGAAGRRAGPGAAGATYRRWFDALPGRAARARCASTGASRPASCTSTATTSCWPRCGSATSC